MTWTAYSTAGVCSSAPSSASLHQERLESDFMQLWKTETLPIAKKLIRSFPDVKRGHKLILERVCSFRTSSSLWTRSSNAHKVPRRMSRTFSVRRTAEVLTFSTGSPPTGFPISTGILRLYWRLFANGGTRSFSSVVSHRISSPPSSLARGHLILDGNHSGLLSGYISF